MKTLALTATLLALTGCTRFAVTQRDITSDPATSTAKREIVTEVRGTAWFSSAQAISKLRAQQTDKTQSFNSDSINQQGATNAVAVLEALARIVSALPK